MVSPPTGFMVAAGLDNLDRFSRPARSSAILLNMKLRSRLPSRESEVRRASLGSRAEADANHDHRDAECGFHFPVFALRICVVFAIATQTCRPGLAATDTAREVDLPAGPNFSVAAFRWWHPAETRLLRGVVVLVPGSNADGREQVDDAFWQEFARRNDLALVGCWFKDHPHENMNIEDYARAADGSGQALLDAVDRLAKAAAHPEAAAASLLLWGHSAGGEFNYEFVCWKPARVLAFVVNKGGYYFTHLAPAAARAVPGIFFIGGKDEAFRIQSIQGIVAVNLQAGAAWKLVVEPDAGHEPGRTRELAVAFFAEVIARRLPAMPPAQPASAPV